MRRVINYLAAAAAIFFLAMVTLAIPSFFDPEFEVANNSSGTVSVVAAWRSHEKMIGNIAPMSSYEFSVDDEAAMIFRVHYASGKEVESEPMYFTSGTKVIATISGDSMVVRYDFETKQGTGGAAR